MPQISAVVINDGAGTPVAHTLSPIGKDKNGVFWFEQTIPAPVSPLGAIRMGYLQTRILDRRKQLTGMSKVTYTIHVPTLETLSNNSGGIVPPPTLAYEEIARVEFTLAERSAYQERVNTRALIRNLLSHAMPTANVDTLQPSYA